MLSIKPEALAQLSQVIKTGIMTLEPHAGSRGPGPFSGTYDWHSCVHAHWALLSMERFGAPVDDWLHTRLSRAVLEVEFKYLKDNPTFERPYGRVWLLLLINELRRQGLSDTRLESLNDRLQRELIEYLQTHPFPEHPDRDYPYLGTHYSWMFTHWMGALSTQLNGDDVSEYQALYESRVYPLFDDLRKHDPVPNDFLDLGVMADLEILLWQSAKPGEVNYSEIPVSINSKNARMTARLFQELWAQAIYNSASIKNRFDGLLEKEYLWKFDFQYASHFVPQFAWMAVYLSEFFASKKTA